MAILFSAKQIKKSFGVRPLFDNLTFVIESEERLGLIGPNGAGKSTLLKIMAGLEDIDSGEVSFPKGLRVGYLEQNPVLPKGKTVEESVYGVAKDFHDSAHVALAGILMSKLELNSKASQLTETLSGGWKKRVALARELMKDPELLLLDEPTNHLDIESILWLEDFLAKARFATLTITHDRLFLQRVSNRILELDRRNPGGLLSVKGDYATYLDRKEALLSAQEQQESMLRNKLRRETEWLRRGPKARTTKQQARIQAAEQLQQSVSELEYRNQSRIAQIDFQSNEKKPKKLVEAIGITKAYGDKILFQNADVFIGPGSRIGLLGGNGSGKSTLIRILLGTEEPDEGKVFRSEHLKVAYFEQNRETLDPRITLRKAVCPYGDQVNYRGRLIHVQGYLDRFLFRKEQTDMLVGSLSGGEQARVLIARLMQQEANVLVLDEPTNDLDVQTLDVLQECLTEFQGAVLLVTHDRYFLDQVATEIYAFPSPEASPKVITVFSGLAQWESWRDAKEREKKNTVREASLELKTKSPNKRKLSFNESRELSQIEGVIQEQEEILRKLEADSQNSSHLSNSKKLAEIFHSLHETQLKIEKLYARWAELEKIQNGS